jgi:hypothetical protein
LVIITFRPEFTPPWIGRPHVTLLCLSRLPPRQCADVILQLTRDRTLPQEIVDQIIDRTDGMPLFIEELTKAVLESGVLAQMGERYSVAGSVEQLPIPTSLQASLLARLDRLGPARDSAHQASNVKMNLPTHFTSLAQAYGRAAQPELGLRELFCRAISIARCQSARLLELTAVLSLARLWREQGKRTEARDLLAPIYGWFTEGFDTPVLQDAKTLLDELG